MLSSYTIKLASPMGSHERFSATKVEKNSRNSFGSEPFGFEIGALMLNEIHNGLLYVSAKELLSTEIFQIKETETHQTSCIQLNMQHRIEV